MRAAWTTRFTRIPDTPTTPNFARRPSRARCASGTRPASAEPSEVSFRTRVGQRTGARSVIFRAMWVRPVERLAVQQRGRHAVEGAGDDGPLGSAEVVAD